MLFRQSGGRQDPQAARHAQVKNEPARAAVQQQVFSPSADGADGKAGEGLGYAVGDGMA